MKTFCDAAETLLSPVIMQTPLSAEERDMLKMYLASLEKVVANGTAATTPAPRVF
jgi:hypothetical protein